MSMETDALRWFQQVADGTTVTELADVEPMTQSGISRALARLESQVGTALLQRSGRQLRLTHAGPAFKQHVDALIHQLDDGIAAVNQLRDPDHGVIALGFEPGLGSWLVPRLMRDFATTHPTVSFALTESTTPHGALLQGGRVDLEIGTREPGRTALASRPVLTYALSLAVSSGHSLAEHATVGPSDVADEVLIRLRAPSSLERATDELLREAAVTPRATVEVTDLASATALVAAGHGVAIVPPDGDASATHDALHYLPITSPAATQTIVVSASSERRLLPAPRLFRDHVVAWSRVRERG
jgi:LysR family transcriptional activator of glutamate synthase operon